MVFNAETTREQLSEKALSGLEEGGAKLLADDRQFVTGANVTLPDFILFEQINFVNQITKGQNDTAFTKFPKLEAFHARMAALPGLAEYLAGPEHTSMADIWFPPFEKVGVNSF